MAATQRTPASLKLSRGQGEQVSKPLASPSIVRPIRATDRRTGAALMLVPSQSRQNLWHRVSVTECDCRGFQARGRCSHHAQVQRELGLQNGGAAHLAVMRSAEQWPPNISSSAMARKYAEIFG